MFNINKNEDIGHCFNSNTPLIQFMLRYIRRVNIKVTRHDVDLKKKRMKYS